MEVAMTRFQSKLPLVATNPEQLLSLLELALHIAELERDIQKTGYQKLQEELAREAAVREMIILQNFATQLHANRGKM